MRPLKKFAVLLALLVAAAAAARAQDPPTITIRKGDRIAVAVADIGPAAETVKKDLDLSGFVTLVPENQATYVVRGSSTSSGVQGQLMDNRKSLVLARAYSGDTRTAAHQFSDDIVQTLTGKPGIAGKKIAFVASRTGRKEIYLCDYDGKNVSQLTRDNGISVSPSLSPDGARLAYTSYLSGYADIYVITLAGGSRSRVVKFPGTNSGAAFSPDGSQIACTVSKDGNPELYVVGAGGGGARRLTRSAGVESSPTWSPNGSELIFTSDDGGTPQLYRMSAGGGRMEKLNTGYAYCTEPSWAPDGTKIAFNTRVGGVFQVAIMDLQNGGTRIVTSGGDAEDPVWGANSRHLLFTQGGNLYLLDAETGKRVSVASGFGKISEPTWAR